MAIAQLIAPLCWNVLEPTHAVLVVSYISGNPLRSKKLNVKAELKEAKEMVQSVQQDEDDIQEGGVSQSVALQKPSQNPTKSAAESTAAQQTKPQPSKPAKPTVQTSKPAAVTSKPGAAASKPAALASKPAASASKPAAVTSKPAAMTNSKSNVEVSEKRSNTSAVTSMMTTRPVDTASISSKISIISEESEAGVDFYEKLMAKYGIELSDDEDND